MNAVRSGWSGCRGRTTSWPPRRATSITASAQTALTEARSASTPKWCRPRTVAPSTTSSSPSSSSTVTPSSSADQTPGAPGKRWGSDAGQYRPVTARKPCSWASAVSLSWCDFSHSATKAAVSVAVADS
ncbi:hypothetical protein SALBM217S_06242 [Streptomyces griseoloalbus]